MAEDIMKRNTSRKRLWRFMFLSAALYGAWELLCNFSAVYLYLRAGKLFLTSEEAVSIGIVGGSDGPTAIFVTAPGWIHWATPVLFVAIGIAGFLRFGGGRKKSSEGED